MSTGKHTPGPWFWNYEGGWVLKRQLLDEDGNHAGYELLNGDYDALANAHEMSTREARLLAVCEELEDELCSGGLETNDGRIDYLKRDRFVKVLRAAIAKGDRR